MRRYRDFSEKTYGRSRVAAVVLSMAFLVSMLSGCGLGEAVQPDASQEAGGDQGQEAAGEDKAGEQNQITAEDEAGKQGQEAGAGSDNGEESNINSDCYPLPEQPEEAGVYIEPIEGLREDFIRGVDISSVLVQEESGVVYYNEDGQEQDIFKTLAENGVNYIRVRVWNDPYDENGNGYGGGNNDTAKAAEIGRRAAQYHMKLCVDYHYSDFWADPAKQMCPKAWEGMAIEDKSEALYAFTAKSLTEILDAGADVGMVQIGNEINNGIAGETDWTKRRQLLQAGSRAVREVAAERGKRIQIAVHFTDVSDQEGTLALAQKLEDKEIDYDIFAVSYYPFWHGTLENLTETLQLVADTYDKKVLVAENSYPYTPGDGDGSANSIGEADILPAYAATVQGQANEVRDVCAAVAATGEPGLGFFYWEPAWIPVHVWDESAADAESVLAANRQIWEEKGSGWASSYAAGYDPKDAGVYYGGSSWDNQALFDYNGQPLESLKVFKYLQCGTLVDRRVESIPTVEVNVPLGGKLQMPATADVCYNDRSVTQFPVDWNAEQLAAIDTSVGGEYEVTGNFVTEMEDENLAGEAFEILADSSYPWHFVAHITVSRRNLLENASFEEADRSMWKITGNGTDYQDKTADAHSGDLALHFWSNDAVSFTVEQEVTGLAPGTYEFGLYLQGGDAGEDADLYIYADNGQEQITEKTAVSGWCNWQNPAVKVQVGEDGALKVGASVSCAAKGWGTLDDWYLYQIE